MRITESLHKNHFVSRPHTKKNPFARNPIEGFEVCHCMEPFIGFREKVSKLSETYRQPSKAFENAQDFGKPVEVFGISKTIYSQSRE